MRRWAPAVGEGAPLGRAPGHRIAFEFLVLAACRSVEIRGARWDEAGLEGEVLRIPAGRMKARREHRVPLSDRAFAVLDEARRNCPVPAGSCSAQKGRMQGHLPMGRLMKELEIGAVSHGFRSSFRDWAVECTEAPREVCELALAHVNGDCADAAYRRSDLFKRRRALMRQWADISSREVEQHRKRAIAC